MKHEAEQELIKALTGQIKEIPTVAKTMVQQYQMSAIVMATLCVAVLVIAIIGSGILLRYTVKEAKKNHSDVLDDDGVCFAVIVAFATNLPLMFMLCVNLIHACTPITSLVNNFFN